MKLTQTHPLQRVHPWILALIAAGVVGGSWLVGTVSRERSQQANLERHTILVQRRTVQAEITASGRVVPIRNVNISPKISGRLMEVLVDQGQPVQQGQVIARMDNRDVQAKLLESRAQVAELQARLVEVRRGNRVEVIAQAEAQVSASQARVQEAEARLNMAQQVLKRYQMVYGEGGVSARELDQYQTEVNQAQASLTAAQAQQLQDQQRLRELRKGSREEDIAQSEAQLMAAIGRLRATEVQMQDTIIRAPFSGIVSQRFADQGAFVTPTTSASATASATSTSIVAIAQGIEVIANVPEIDISRIRVGQPVTVIADAYPDRRFTGRVRLIAPEAVKEQNVTNFQVRVTLTSGLDLLRSGMNVDLNFQGEQLKDAFLVPTVAIVTQEGQPGVLIPDVKGNPDFQPVTLGATVGNETQILQGIRPEQRIFIDLPAGKRWEDQDKEKAKP
jgi:HlyD family secretion protein